MKAVFCAMIVFLIAGVARAGGSYHRFEIYEAPTGFSVSCEPINPMGTILPSFALPYESTVSAVLKDTLDNIVFVFDTETLLPGLYQPDWWPVHDTSGREVENGLYVFELKAVATVAGYENIYYARQPYVLLR